MTAWRQTRPCGHVALQCPVCPKAADQASLFDHLVGASERRVLWADL